MTATAAPPVRHLRPRGGAATQPTTTVELFFDLVYVFAVTQLSHQILGDLTPAGVARAAFLLLIVWWAWIYTTWMANWFDPGSPAVRVVLTAVMLCSLLMAAALPEAFGERAWLFAGSYVALQVGRNAAAALLLRRRHRLRDVFGRLVVWSAASGVLWLAGAALDGDQRLALWIPALALELAAPAAGYWLPRRGRAATSDYDIEGGHFAERCQLFIIIALGESIVVSGATASAAGLTPTVVACLVVAFVQTAALWWLYFGATAEQARITLSTCDDPGRLARDAYTYLHLPIVAGIIATAVGTDLLIAEPHHALHGVGLAMMLGGPALFLFGESLFHRRMTETTNGARVAVGGFLLLLSPVGGQLSALLLGATVAAVLTALVLFELRSTLVSVLPPCSVERAMARYTASLETQLPPADTFAYLSDFSTTEEWDPGVVEAERLGDGPVGAGSEFRVVAEFLGRTSTLVYRIVEFVPGETVTLRGENATVVSLDRISVEPVGSASRVSYDAELTLKGPLRIADPLLGLAFNRVGERALEGLRGTLARKATPAAASGGDR